MSAIIDCYAGVPVTDLDASLEWYTRFFGREPDFRAGDEILWETAAHAYVFIEPACDRAGTGRITLGVTGLDDILARLQQSGIAHEPVETYANGVRHASVPDPDGNAIAFAESPE